MMGLVSQVCNEDLKFLAAADKKYKNVVILPKEVKLGFLFSSIYEEADLASQKMSGCLRFQEEKNFIPRL